MQPTKLQSTLGSVLEGLQFTLTNPSLNLSVDEELVEFITADSRKVKPGSVFIAIAGSQNDGHDFIGQAIKNGCKAIICTAGKLRNDQVKSLAVAVIEVVDTAKAYAIACANFFARPADKLHLIGLTGTNGKTTVSYLLEHVLCYIGFSVGVIGTVNSRYTTKAGDKNILSTGLTTPEPFLLQKMLWKMANNGVYYVIMEVSSHGLAQSRVTGLLFDVAGLTNLSRDHLDYHKEMKEYFWTKAKLFSDHLKDSGTAVLPHWQSQKDTGNKKWLKPLYELCRTNCSKIIRWGIDSPAEIRLQDFTSYLDHTDIHLETSNGQYRLSSTLIGRFNIDNILTTIGICVALTIDEYLICKALTTARSAPGRMERLGPYSCWDNKAPTVLVDFAHTPDALEKVLHAAKNLPHQKLICVFGCGGDRDGGKRPLMGEIAANLCDIVIITDDNPRTEDPELIVEQIVVGIAKSPLELKNKIWFAARSEEDRGCVVIRDRKEAIEAAIKGGGANDIVVIAGKGHEPYQLTADGKRFFDDCLEAKTALFSWTADLIATAVNGILHSEDNLSRMLGAVTTDSRITNKNGIFVALRGDIYDGHDFAQQALDNGASCLIVERPLESLTPLNYCQIVVKDSLKALGDLAGFRRRRLAKECEQIIIGITGSSGKTTVKEMTAAILKQMWSQGDECSTDYTLKTPGNLNNLIGLPLSLLPLEVHHRVAVLEMGMNRFGELRRLGQISRPDISCITNIHDAHLEGLLSVDGIAEAKRELFDMTNDSGVLIINLEDCRVRAFSDHYGQRKITFAVHGEDMVEKPDLWACEICMDKRDYSTFTLCHGSKRAKIRLSSPGEHNIANALCAAAIGIAAGAGLDDISAGLMDFHPPKQRMEILQTKDKISVLNDTYNANPASMAAGLKTLRQIAPKTAVAVIGDMLELGDSSKKAHYAIGKLLANLEIDHVGFIGEYSNDVLRGALDHGFDELCIHAFENGEDAVLWIQEMMYKNIIGQDDVILVKASRGLRFETIVEKLTDTHLENKDIG